MWFFCLRRRPGRLTGSRSLVLAGGVALNCVANGKLLRKGTFDDIWIQPAAGDAGGALGAAYAAWHIGKGKPRKPSRRAGRHVGGLSRPRVRRRGDPANDEEASCAFHALR